LPKSLQSPRIQEKVDRAVCVRQKYCNAENRYWYADSASSVDSDMKTGADCSKPFAIAHR